MSELEAIFSEKTSKLSFLIDEDVVEKARKLLSIDIALFNVPSKIGYTRFPDLTELKREWPDLTDITTELMKIFGFEPLEVCGPNFFKFELFCQILHQSREMDLNDLETIIMLTICSELFNYIIENSFLKLEFGGEQCMESGFYYMKNLILHYFSNLEQYQGQSYLDPALKMIRFFSENIFENWFLYQYYSTFYQWVSEGYSRNDNLAKSEIPEINIRHIKEPDNPLDEMFCEKALDQEQVEEPISAEHYKIIQDRAQEVAEMLVSKISSNDLQNHITSHTTLQKPHRRSSKHSPTESSQNLS